MASNPASQGPNPIPPTGNPAPQITASSLPVPGGTPPVGLKNNDVLFVKTLGGKKGSKKMNCGGKSRKGRKLSGPLKDWNVLVTDVFNKGRAKNSKYSFKQALKDASRMKKKNKTMKK
uniref:Uncharacterized protein n=1 Tax=viral metagenome TaxID=1070528 RepID=A0A6C0JJU5_9ZZZZ